MRLHNKMINAEKLKRNRSKPEKNAIDDRVLDIVNSVSYDTLMSIKKAVQTRESAEEQASEVAESSAKVSLQQQPCQRTSSMSSDLYRSKRSEDLTSVIKDLNFNLQEMQLRHSKT